MKKVILDSSFIISCVKQKIDFFEEIKLIGLRVLIPTQVINEIEKVANSKKKFHIKKNAKLALEILKTSDFKKIELESEYVDDGLVEFAKKNKSVIVATLDRELKKKLKNSKLIIRGKKKLEIA